MKKIAAIAISLNASLAAGFAHAQDTAQDDAIELETLILSGGLSPISEEALGRALTLITAEEIEEKGITTMQDVLRAVPSVAVSSAGNNATQVRIRGGEGNHTLILIDGVVAAGGDDEYFLSGFDVANIESVEVLRGPQSVYYGSNASSGVINIVTKKGEIGTQMRGTLEYGNGVSSSAFISKRVEQGGISLSLSQMNDEGWDFSGSDGEKDETNRQSIVLNGDYAITPELTIGFTARKSSEEYDFDRASYFATTADEYVIDDPDMTGEFDELTARIYADLSTFDGRVSHHLSLEKTKNERISNGGKPTETTRDAIKYRMGVSLDGNAVEDSDQLINIFLEHQENTSSTQPDYERQSQSIAVEYRANYFGALDVQAGVRKDFNDPFEDATTWNLGLAYEFDSGARLHASAGTGVVNPSYFELYADQYGTTGNPDLKPETNKSYDFGIELPIASLGSIDFTYFNETLTDEITFVSTGPGTYSYENQSGESTRKGLEVSSQLALTDNIDLRASYTYLNAKNPDGSIEIRRPKHEYTLGATIRAFDDRASFAADLRHVSENYDAQFFGAYELAKLPDYTTVDVAAHYQITENVKFTGRITNLTDEKVVDVWGYAGRPRTGYVGLDVSW